MRYCTVDFTNITHHVVEEIKVGNLRLSIEQRTEMMDAHMLKQ